MAESNPNPTARDYEEEEGGGEQDPTARDYEEEEGGGEQEVFFKPNRHEHELRLFEGLPAYRCDGCKEYGANIGYKCSSSSCRDFTLHHACATVPDVFQHPFRGLFKFRPKTRLRHHCDACQDVLKGFVFETERPAAHIRLHPLCMVLPDKFHHSGHANHQLKLVTGDLKGDAYACSACNKMIKSGGWRYRCEEVACNVSVDLSCSKIDIYQLLNSGIARVAPLSRSRRFRSKLSASVKWVAPTLVEATIEGVAEAVFDSIIN